MQTITRNILKYAVVFTLLAAMLGAGFNTSVAYAASCSPTVFEELWAKTGTATLYGTTSVPILGYAATSTDPATLPGPVLEVNAGDCVQVTLHNVDVPSETALLFQGQAMIPDTTGVAAGGSAVYTFSAATPGTFLYEAGLVPGAQYQVAMGLYGTLIIRPATVGQAYDDASTAYNSESVMVLSELDPALNTDSSPVSFDMRDYSPQYFLINGKAFPDAAPITANPGSTVLMRYVNAGLQAHAMSTLGLSQTIIAQDGEPYAHSHNVVAETIATGQTLDTLITVPASSNEGDQFAIYDANMLLHNTSDAGFGGMMTFLAVGAGAPPPPPDSGPAVSGLALAPNPTDGSVDVTVSATVTDGGTSASNIMAAEFYIDGTSNTPNAMTAVDLAFDSTSEDVEGTISMATLGSLSSGNHTIFVRGQDANLNWGPFVSIVLNLDKSGPVTSGLSLTPNPSDGFVPVNLTATGDDSTTGGSDVTAAEYWVDTDAPIAMAVDGAVSAATNFTATIPAGLSMGSHVVSVRSQDAFGNWGAVTTISLQVGDTAAPTTSNIVASPNPTNGQVGYNTSVPAVRVTADFDDTATGGSNIVAAEGFIDAVGSTGSGFAFISTDGGFNSPSESGYADIPLAVVQALSDGDHTLYVHAKDAGGNWGDPNAATAILTVDKTGPTFNSVSISPAGTTRGGGTATVTITGNISPLADLDFSSGAYTITDSKSSNVVTGALTIAPNGDFTLVTEIDRSNNGPNNANNRRYYTFTLSAADTFGNIGTATVQFWVQ